MAVHLGGSISSLQRMHVDIDSHTRSLEGQKRRLKDLEIAVEKCKKELEEKSKKYKILAREYKERAVKDHKILENLLQKLNILKLEDNTLIESINDVRQNTKQHEQIFRNLKQEIGEQTRELLRQTSMFEQAQAEKEEMLGQAKAIGKRMKHQRKEFIEMAKSMRQDYHRQTRIQKDIELKKQRLDSTRPIEDKKADSKSNNIGYSGGGSDYSSPLSKSGGMGSGSSPPRSQSPNNRMIMNSPISHKTGFMSPITTRTGFRVPHAKNRKEEKKKYIITSEEAEFDSELFCRKIFRNSFMNTIQRRRIKQYSKTIEVYEQAFDTIKTSTGIQNIEEIVRIFSAMEDRSFSLLNYVNTLHSDIEDLEAENKKLLQLSIEQICGGDVHSAIVNNIHTFNKIKDANVSSAIHNIADMNMQELIRMKEAAEGKSSSNTGVIVGETVGNNPQTTTSGSYHSPLVGSDGERKTHISPYFKTGVVNKILEHKSFHKEKIPGLNIKDTISNVEVHVKDEKAKEKADKLKAISTPLVSGEDGDDDPKSPRGGMSGMKPTLKSSNNIPATNTHANNGKGTTSTSTKGEGLLGTTIIKGERPKKEKTPKEIERAREVEARALMRKRAILAGLEHRIKVEKEVVTEKETDIHRTGEIMSKVRDPLLKTVDLIKHLLPIIFDSNPNKEIEDSSSNKKTQNGGRDGGGRATYGGGMAIDHRDIKDRDKDIPKTTDNRVVSHRGDTKDIKDAREMKDTNNTSSGRDTINARATMARSETRDGIGFANAIDMCEKGRISMVGDQQTPEDNKDGGIIDGGGGKDGESSRQSVHGSSDVGRERTDTPVREKEKKMSSLGHAAFQVELAETTNESSTIPEFLAFIETNLLHFRDYLPGNAPLRILSKPAVYKPTMARRPQDLPNARIEDSESDIEEIPLSRAELRMHVEKTLCNKKKKHTKHGGAGS